MTEYVSFPHKVEKFFEAPVPNSTLRNLSQSLLSIKKERWVDQDQSLNLKTNTA